jgi:subtilase family serine protease
MPTRQPFGRRSAGLGALLHAAMGLALGLVTSCVADSDGQSPSESIDQATRVTMDLVGDTDIPTGSVCGKATPGGTRCFAHVQAVDGHVQTYATPTGFGATDLEKAYNLPTAITGKPTVALIDAYGYATLEADLAVYRTQYGLPACTSASGCLKIVNQTGAATPLPGPPPASDDWTLETALDVDMASAACPTCNLIVVQATDDTGGGLEMGQAIAVSLGATVISNSWGGPEQPGQSLDTVETYFAQPGVAIFVAAGDAGYDDGGSGPDYPGTSAHTISVGGTHLVKDTSTRGWTETAWSAGGSACSLSVAKPAYQTNASCNFKATTDISAVGDPQTGVAMYNSKDGGWQVIGGTSAAAPLVAAIFAATGNGGETSGAFVMTNAAKLYDVTSGTNGTCGNVLCKAGTGWDGPTGYGTPNATALVVSPITGTGSGSGSGGGTGGGGNGGTPITDGSNEIDGGCAAGGSSAGFAMMILVLGGILVRRSPQTR